MQQACQMQRPINLEHQGSHVVGLLLLLIGIIICISYFCIFVIVIVFGIFCNLRCSILLILNIKKAKCWVHNTIITSDHYFTQTNEKINWLCAFWPLLGDGGIAKQLVFQRAPSGHLNSILASLVALHFTPVKFRTSVALRLASLFV